MAEGWAVLASCIARYATKHAIAENIGSTLSILPDGGQRREILFHSRKEASLEQIFSKATSYQRWTVRRSPVHRATIVLDMLAPAVSTLSSTTGS